MRAFWVTILVGFFTLWPCAYGTVNARNGVTINTSSTINGKTPNSAVNGQTVAAASGPLVAFAAASATNPNTVTTAEINTTAANLIVIAVSAASSAGDSIYPSDSQSNTWTGLTWRDSGVGGGNSVRIFYCYAPTTNSSHTFSFPHSSSYATILVMAFSGMASSPFDVEGGNAFTSAVTSFPSGSVTPSQANTIVITALAVGDLSTAPSIDSGFTVQCVGPGVGGSSWAGAAGYKVLTAASAQNPTWTTAASSIGATSTAVFKY